MRGVYLSLIVALVTITPTGARAASSTPITGAQVYADTCNRCHSFRSPVEFDDRQWAVVITHMRVVGGIPGDEARLVLEYLRANNNPPRAVRPKQASDAVPQPAASVEWGSAVVQQRGCEGCHVISGRGGTMGPSLDGVTLRRHKDFIRTQLRDSRQNNTQSLMPNLGLTESEIDSIWLYLSTLNGEAGER